MYDEVSVSFENPATDALGYDHVEGRLYCGRDAVYLQFKVKDRAFRKNEIQNVVFDFSEIESVQFVSRWFRPKLLVFQTRVPEKLDGFPGSNVGRVELRVFEGSLGSAPKLVEFIRFKQSEAFLAESEDRLDRLRENA